MKKDNSIEQNHGAMNGFRLFLMGFITLFLELALIRYLAANIWNMGYFPNLVLIAVFIGMGAGFIFHHYLSDRFSALVFHAAPFMLLFLIVFVYYGRPSVPGFERMFGEIGGELFLTNMPEGAEYTSYAPFIVCFLSVVAVFAFLSQRAAKLFRLFKPLTAYSLDIGGSITGIILFILISFLEIPPFLWFALFIAAFIAAMGDSLKTRWIPVLPGAALLLFAHIQDARLLSYPDYAEKLEVFWSPYQKVEYISGVVFVNGVGHQRMETELEGDDVFYQKPYIERKKDTSLQPYRNVLIIGSGTGNDAAAALLNGVEHVDAVEIDPVIAKLGIEHHSYKPYSDSRVNLILDDGRAVMTRTDKKYDLIIFALTDSLVKVSPVAQLRLENYLFTEEAARRAYDLLNDGGDMVYYNFYRRPWLVDKLEAMIWEATGEKPHVIELPEDMSILIARKKPKRAARVDFKAKYDVPTDDWPFLYLKNRGLPSIYRKAILAMCLFVALLVIVLNRAAPRAKGLAPTSEVYLKSAFVFMGLAFLLLETKSVIQFSLLFGATWLNNSLVFLAVLVLALAANWTALLLKSKRILFPVYILLLVSSLSGLVYPLGNLVELESPAARFALASILTFSPVYFANLIFSLTFREIDVAEHIFGWNLIGATLGGLIEYSSMALGYNRLSIIVAASYTLVYVFLIVAGRRAVKESI